MAEFLMPSLGADMEAGTVVEWRIGPGDEVHRGDIVAVVDTDKSDIEVEVFDDGVVEELLVPEGETVPVGTPLARIGTGATTTSDPGPASRAEPGADRGQAPPDGERAPSPHPAPSAEGHVRASPRARRQAAAAGIDLAAVQGSGPGGAVVVDDLAGDDASPAPQAPSRHGRPDTERRVDAMRRATGALMARSAREIPHYHLATTIEVGDAVRWLDGVNAQRSVADRILPAALLLRATALAAAEVPGFNGTWEDGYRPSAAVDLGVAVSLRGGGLVAPGIPDAASLGVEQLMVALRDLVARARSGRLRSSEVAGATLTVTNLGDRGADEVHGLVHPPQVALVGFGRVRDRPWAERGLLGVRPTVTATLAADHRVTEGHEGSRFLAAIDDLLHVPEDL